MLKRSRKTLLGILIGVILGAIALTNPVRAQTEEGGELRVISDIQEANSETGVITARGNVQIDYPARQLQATATQAQYFTKEGRLVLSGDVYVLQNGNSMRAETMTYIIDEGRFIATPEESGQVESIYIVSEDEPNTTIELPESPQFNSTEE